MFMTICIVSEDGLSHVCTLTPLQHCPARLCQMVSNKCIASRVMTHSNVVGMLSPCIQSFSMHSQAEQKISATVGNAVRAYSSRSAHLYATNAKHCFNLCLSSVIGLACSVYCVCHTIRRERPCAAWVCTNNTWVLLRDQISICAHAWATDVKSLSLSLSLSLSHSLSLSLSLSPSPSLSRVIGFLHWKHKHMPRVCKALHRVLKAHSQLGCQVVLDKAPLKSPNKNLSTSLVPWLQARAAVMQRSGDQYSILQFCQQPCRPVHGIQ